MKAIVGILIMAAVALSAVSMAGCATDGKYTLAAWCGSGLMLTTDDPNATMRIGPSKKVDKDEGTDEVATD